MRPEPPIAALMRISSMILSSPRRQYLYGRPDSLYVDVYHATWVVYQIVGSICHAVVENVEVSLSDFIHGLRARTPKAVSVC